MNHETFKTPSVNKLQYTESRYRILPNTRAGANTKNCIQVRSNDVGRFWDSRTCSFVFNGGKIARSCILNSIK